MSQILRVAAVAFAATAAAGASVRLQLDTSQRDTVLQYMNNLRGQYGAKPLTWDATLQTTAFNHDQIIKCDRTLDRIVEKGAIMLYGRWDRNAAMDLPASLDYHIGSRAEDYADQTNPTSLEMGTAAFTHTVWKSLNQVGCARCEGPLGDDPSAQFAGVVKCVFDQKGNLDNQFAAQVGKKGDKYDKCADAATRCTTTDQCHTSVCNADTGECRLNAKADATVCQTGGKTGECFKGDCIYISPCQKNMIVCKPLSQCHVAGVCDDTTLKCSNPVKVIDAEKGITNLDCDDGNAQTLNDKCVQGVCVGEDKCKDVQCSNPPGPVAKTTCQLPATCNYLTGACVAGGPLVDGYRCTDGNPATTGDQCASGTCVGTDKCAGKVCTSQKACQKLEGTCNAATGQCEFVDLPVGAPCDDETPNTVNEKCNAAGVCVGEDLCKNVTCTPKNECFTVACDPKTGACVQTRKGTSSSSDKAMGECKTCEEVTCRAASGCSLAGTCNPTTYKCEYPTAPVGTPCDDDRDNTVGDVCNADGVCVGTDKCANVVCKAADTCHVVGVCDKNTGKCSNPIVADPANTECNDGNPGTSTMGKCQADGKCFAEPLCSPTTCKTTDACKVAVCENQVDCVIKNAADGLVCNDGNADTVDDKCASGVCVGTDLCKDVRCDPLTTCFNKGECDKKTGLCIPSYKNGATCDDGNAKTKDDTCQGGLCTGTPRCRGVVCDPKTCHTSGVCNGLTGQCEYTAMPENTPCDDGDAKTKWDKCTSAARCVGVADMCKDVTCPVKGQCYAAGACDTAANTGMCKYEKLANGKACDDGSSKTKDDVCKDGVCVGVDKCAGVVCDSTFCEAKECQAETGECIASAQNMGKECAKDGSTCKDGTCVNACKGVTCEKEPECYVSNICAPATGKCVMVKMEVNTPCDDGNRFTVNDTCVDKQGGGFGCVGTGICEGVTCPKASNSCQEDGACDPVRALDGEVCFQKHKADGATCTDGDATTFGDACLSGECVGKSCSILVLEPVAGSSCDAAGSYGFTSEGNLYVWGGCRAQFMVRLTGEVVTCAPDTADYTECDLKHRMTEPECLPAVSCPASCTAKSDCHEVGSCDPRTGECSTPLKPDGTLCDDGDAATTDDKCDQGTCEGVVEPPQCFRASKWWPSRECMHDPDACNWGNGVWRSMEECCRPGKGHAKGCAPEDPKPEECWRPGTWWPTRECVKDMDACDWGLGTHVWESKKECCKAGNGFDCGCKEEPDTTTCWTRGTAAHSCVETQMVGSTCDRSKDAFDTEAQCCSQLHGSCSVPCKTLDVVLVLDGSGSMRKCFTSHPHGFYAMMEMLRDWTTHLPLSMEAAGAATATGGTGVRVGLVQFSSRSVRSRRVTGGKYYKGQVSHAVMAKTNGGTGGRLSGDGDQLRADIRWHGNNFLNYGTMVSEGLRLAAGLFEDVDRPRAVIIISDGEIFDTKFATTKAALATLDRKNVVVFGVVVRRHSCHSQVDWKAEKALKPILSRPFDDHYFNLEIDEVPDKVLNGVCNPKSKWGQYIRDMSPKGVVPAAKVDPNKFNPVSVPSANPGVFLVNKKQKVFADVDCDALHGQDTCGATSACDSVADGVSVNIEEGYLKGYDTLSCSGCRANGIRARFQVSTGVLFLTSKQDKTVRQWTEALAMVDFLSTARKCVEDRQFTYAYGGGVSSSTVSGHLYEYFPRPSRGAIRWDEAQAACAKRTRLGMKGYLMTVTTPAEQAIAKRKLAGDGWLGASDAGKEGEWRWVSGPEGCPPSASCDLGDLDKWTNGKATGGAGLGTKMTKAYWKNAEPNDYRKNCPGSCRVAGEDFAHAYYPSGQWNDYPIDHRGIEGYMCEWGNNPLGSCLSNHVGTRGLACKSSPTIPTNPCAVRPTKPVGGSDGCATGWVSVEDGVTVEWCSKNCLKKGKITKECRPGNKEKCACVADQVQQCRCADTGFAQKDEYCADTNPLASGLRKCYEATTTLEGVWDEVSTDQTPVDPTAATCYVYDRAAKTWAAGTTGLCLNAQGRFHTRYIYSEPDVSKCKAMCESKEQCLSVSAVIIGKYETCHINTMPVGSCAAGQRRCAPSQKRPTGASRVCGCDILKKGATAAMDRVCTSLDSRGKTVCTPPSDLGVCASGEEVCVRTPVFAVKVGGGMTLAALQKAIAAAAGVSKNDVQIKNLCPTAECKR